VTVRLFAAAVTRAKCARRFTVDIIRHCAEQPNTRVRALLRSRALNESQINHFLILACARMIRTYITHRHERGGALPGEPGINILLHRMNIPTLARRVNLDAALTTRAMRELVPDVITQLHLALGNDHSLLNLFDRHDAA
jgi:hypothetical protein